MSTRTVLLFFVLGWVNLFARPLATQQTPPPAAAGEVLQATVPTLRVSTQIVLLDVVVVDKSNRVVNRNFTEQDFHVLEDDVPQTILSFEPPSAHRMPPGDGAIVHSAADLKKIGDAPITVMVLDELNGRFEDMAYARQKMVSYLQAQPPVLRQPTVLLIATNTRFVQVHDFTQDRDALIEVIKKHMPEFPWTLARTGPSGPGAVERMAQVMAALQQIAQATSGSGGRKNIIWVGNGFPSANLVGLDPYQSDRIEAAFRRITAYLLASHVTVYTINPTEESTSTVDVSGPDDLGLSVNENGGDPFGTGGVAFANLAPFTGGYSFTGRNDLNNLIAQAIDDGQSFYTLSYSPTNKSDDPTKFRKIKVTMTDPNLRALTRDGYYQATGSEINPVLVDKDTSEKQVKRNLTLDLSQALTSAMSYNGLDVSVARAAGDAWTVSVRGSGVGWSDPDAKGAQHEEATVGAAWYDAKGKILGHIFREQIAPRPADLKEPDTFTLQVPLPTSGVARIRFVVRDAMNGHMGTADVTKF